MKRPFLWSYAVFWGICHVESFQSHNPIARSPFRDAISLSTRIPSRRVLLTTKSIQQNEEEKKVGVFRKAINKFKARPGTYMLIPCVAAVVGWFTNWLAVQMIFYPVKYWGIPLIVREENPLGFIGWQGIVPCKTKTMTFTMVEMVTTQLLTVQEAFQRLSPHKIANLLGPQVPLLAQEVIKDITPFRWMSSLPSAVFAGLDGVSRGVLASLNKQFLVEFTRDLQANIDSVFNIQNCVGQQMLANRAKLGQLFQVCGSKELTFLTNSGLWFGFLLGLIQMAVALFWDNPWSLSIGGGIVGMATNWLALKWIFQPVDPTRIGPFVLQGQFLRRQTEVAKEFSSFFANQVLTAEQLWKSVLTDPSTRPAFDEMFTKHFTKFCNKVSRGLAGGVLEPETMRVACSRALDKLPNHLPVLFPYMDRTLGLETTLRTQMEKMSSLQFERVLHPIFEQDELTLILAGAALGFAAGLVQQGLETGTIQCPDVIGALRRFWKAPRKELQAMLVNIRSSGWNRIQSVRQGVQNSAKRLRKMVSRNGG